MLTGTFRIAETPANPVWVVSIWKDYYFEEFGETETWNVNVVVVDAITGEILGHGTPIP